MTLFLEDDKRVKGMRHRFHGVVSLINCLVDMNKERRQVSVWADVSQPSHAVPKWKCWKKTVNDKAAICVDNTVHDVVKYTAVLRT
jgi:hypothetical protein